MCYFAPTLVVSFYFGTALVTVCSRITLVHAAFYWNRITINLKSWFTTEAQSGHICVFANAMFPV